ncbi:MAG: DUF3408 domain-containing protein [Tannerellaceae bacterium]|nr:DUF3408 domain-containing protein [Tannerellaceae bacterium]
MFGSETEQTAILGNAQPTKRKEVVATSGRAVPDGTDVHTSPGNSGEATGITTVTPIPTDDPEVVAAPDEYGRVVSSAPDIGIEISGRTIIPIPGNQVAECSENTVPTESDTQTLPDGDDKVSAHISPTPLSEATATTDDIAETRPTANSGIIAETQSIIPTVDSDPIRRTVKQRKSDLSEYRATFLPIPKIIDRKPVFLSREVRDRLDRIVRLLGERGMSVSGLIENIVLHHLIVHEADIEHWRKM